MVHIRVGYGTCDGVQSASKMERQWTCGGPDVQVGPSGLHNVAIGRSHHLCPRCFRAHLDDVVMIFCCFEPGCICYSSLLVSVLLLITYQPIHLLLALLSLLSHFIGESHVGDLHPSDGRNRDVENEEEEDADGEAHENGCMSERARQHACAT